MLDGVLYQIFVRINHETPLAIPLSKRPDTNLATPNNLEELNLRNIQRNCSNPSSIPLGTM